MKKIFTILTAVILSTNIYAQKITLKGDVNTDNYPEISFDINVYNPDIKKKADFNLKENENPVDFNLVHKDNNIEDESKVILILFEDMTHKTHFGQRNKCRYILNKSIPGFVKQGDEINIAVFDRNRDGSTPLRFLLKEYTDDPDLLIQKVNNFKTISDYQSNNPSSDLYNAIYDGIEELKTKFPDRNKVLLVFSAGRNLAESNYNSIETLNQRAENESVAVYSMQYMIWEHKNIDVLCSKSFGKKFHIKGAYNINGDHSKETAADSLKIFMNNAVSRLYGQDYKITYNTTFEKDGKLHNAVISLDTFSENIQIKTPDCNIICQFKNNPLLYGGVSLTLILILLLIFILLRKQKKQKEHLQKQKLEEQEAKISKQNADIERIEKENAEKLAKQQEQIKKDKENRIRAEKEKQFAVEQEQKKKEAEEKEKAAILRMQQTGGFPILRATINEEQIEYQINTPEITVGRNSGNSFVLPDQYASGKHFKIFFIDDLYFIEDMGSSNGTILNGQKIQQTKLKHNDIIEAGNSKIMFIH